MPPSAWSAWRGSRAARPGVLEDPPQISSGRALGAEPTGVRAAYTWEFGGRPPARRLGSPVALTTLSQDGVPIRSRPWRGRGRQQSRITSAANVASCDAGLPGGHADPHGCRSVPLGRTAPDAAVGLDLVDQGLGGWPVDQPNEHLVQDHLVQDRQAPGVPAVPRSSSAACSSGDEVSHALSPERAQHGPDFDLAGALRGLGRVVHGFEAGVGGQVAGGGGEGPPQSRQVGGRRRCHSRR